ncbi:hypothetical protein HYZ99_02580 [Candidatus Peregrinibacteria bacterium]|nr:hypothetical protein [Candidatus Peregrinibacteria bacterium]
MNKMPQKWRAILALPDQQLIDQLRQLESLRYPIMQEVLKRVRSMTGGVYEEASAILQRLKTTV